ncbi:MAG: hypothetical protein AB4368_25465 [Xenococcaceae cyanobacterium]
MKPVAKKRSAKHPKRKNRARNHQCLVISEISGNNNQKTHEVLSDWAGAS